MDKSKKPSRVPLLVQKILVRDVHATDQFVKFMDKYLAFRQLKTHYKLLEISAHGLLWLPCWTGLIWVLNSKHLYQMQVNFLLGLILDVIIVAILKAIVRRRRPSKNQSLEIGPDKYSFPSGHASRSFYITYFFIYVWPVHFIFIPALLCWSICICISRVLMRRHHILDVMTGAVLGVALSFIVKCIYLDSETCNNIVWWITDEKLDGGEYHV